MIQEIPTTIFTLCNFSCFFPCPMKGMHIQTSVFISSLLRGRAASLTDWPTLTGADKILLKEPHRLIWKSNPAKNPTSSITTNCKQISNQWNKQTQPQNQLELLSERAPIEDRILIPTIHLEEVSLSKYTVFAGTLPKPVLIKKFLN